MTEQKLNPELDLNLEDGESLGNFLNNLPARYFEGEAEISTDLMERFIKILKETGNKEVSKYPLFDSLLSKENGTGVIVVDFSKLEPQKNFIDLAEEEKADGRETGVEDYEYYAEIAYNLSISVEILGQLLELVYLSKSRLKLAQKDKHFAYNLEFPLKKTKDNAASYNSVNSQKTTGFPWNSFKTLSLFSDYLKLKKIVVVFANTQDIPEYMREKVITRMQRYLKDDKVSGILLRSEEKKE